MIKFLWIFLMPFSLFSQELMGTFSVDTNIYKRTGAGEYGIRGPGNNLVRNLSDFSPILGTDMLSLFQKKGTDQYDIFSFFGKIGSLIIPSGSAPTNSSIQFIIYSQTMINADTNWESVVSYAPLSGSTTYSFKVFDGTGNQLLLGAGVAGYGFDGQNTYVISLPFFSDGDQYFTWRIWKFRSNISSTSKNLAKTSVTTSPMMFFMPSGDLRITLQPSVGGTSLQVFDFLGRQIFGKDIQNMRGHTSYIIPSANLPNSPFVVKVNNSSGSFNSKEIPVGR